MEANGGFYSQFYIDAVGPDGATVTKQVKKFLGNISQMSERAARREHARIMDDVNFKRGSIAPAPKGRTFADAVNNWRSAIAPNLSPGTVQTEFKKSELCTIAKTLGQSIKAFEKQFMSEGMVNPPCPMLDGKLCSIYENRPEVCRSFPHLEQPGFTTRLMGVIDNVAICPIAFNAFEELKTRLRWLQGRRDQEP